MALVPCLWLWAAAAAGPDAAHTEQTQKRMSVHNRVLLNRAAVAGLRDLQVMLAVEPGQGAPAEMAVSRAGGRILRSVPELGYLRVEVPIDQVTAVIANPAVAAGQIASLSRMSWMRDAAPQVNAETFRGFWTSPVVGIAGALPHAEHRLLTVDESRAPGYTADLDAGVGEWLARHPTFDGRGVTIALLEQGQPDFSHPVIGSATALDGTDLPKIAGVLNPIGPEDADESRVALDVDVAVSRTWTLIDNQPYTMPHPGTFHFGRFSLPAGASLVHRYGIVEDATTHEIWIDSDGDGDFGDETAVADVNTRFDVRMLTLGHPGPSRLAFVMARSPAPRTVHVYVGRGAHETMALSVAAGSRTPASLAYGVAPGARVLLVRAHSLDFRLHTFLEAYMQAAARPDVDVVVDSTGVDVAPDTAADFVGLLFDRIAAVYGKPLFHAADNFHLWLASVAARGGSFAVGGSLGPEPFASLFGGGVLDRITVHHASAAGPSIDGGLKPDFLAPMHRIAAGSPSSARPVLLPKNRPLRQLPARYQISCCTSASAPYAAGVAALLLSAAKQSKLPHALEDLRRALSAGARFLPHVPAHQQGNGVVNVNGAWRELNRRSDLPRITTTAGIVHPLAPYAARGTIGQGIFEREGWSAGESRTRELRFTRESGPSGTVIYPVSWLGNDGSFVSPTSIALPLAAAVGLPVSISVREPAAHSAILNLHDPATGAIVFRSLATVVGSEAPDPTTRVARFEGALPLMKKSSHFLRVPDGVGSAVVELEVRRGAVSVAVAPNYGLVPFEYHHLLPQIGRTFLPGTYTAVIPRPLPGVWMIDVGNASARMERDVALVRTVTAEYVVRIRFLSASLRVSLAGRELSVDVENRGAALQSPSIRTSPASLVNYLGSFRTSGLPNLFPIDVPEAASTLLLDARSDSREGTLLEMHLYDCTTGECFSHDFTLPAARTQKLMVRRPKPGRWIAAINAAPFPIGAGGFALDVVVAGAAGAATPVAPPAGRARVPGERWSERLAIPGLDGSAGIAARTRSMNVVLCELIDADVDRAQVVQRWETRPAMPDFRTIPAPLGLAIHPLPREGP